MMIFFIFLISGTLSCTTAPYYPITFAPRKLQTGPPVPGPNWLPISFSISYSNSSSFSSIIDTFIPLALSFYAKSVSVVHQDFVVLNSETCAGVEVPQKYLGASITTDLLLIFTFDPSGPTGAWGQPCEVSEDLQMRPVMGRVHFQGDFSNFTWEQMFAMTVHEIAHVLAYDSRLLPYFQGQIGEIYGLNQVLGYTTRRNNQIAYIKTPKVVEKTRHAFSCNNLYGLDLENTITENSTSLHWEKRVMNNDFMVGDFNLNYITYSDISFSLFEDSGWYSVNYEYADTIVWGYQKGCSFLIEECVVNGNYESDEFCNVSSTFKLCDVTHTFKGSCNLAFQSSPIPAQFQYFENSYYGGSDPIADFCPYVVAASDGSCQGIGKQSTSIDTLDYGESVCENCRCLEGTYVSQFSTLSQHYHAGCHQITCEGDVAVVHVGNQIVFCDPGGGETTIRGYNGYIYCPSSNILCKNLPCPFKCHARGVCTNGVCVCDPGFYGSYCESIGSAIRVVFILLFALGIN